MAPDDHPGISRKRPRGALEFDGDRNDQTAVSRLLRGHLKCMIFESGPLEDVHASPLLVQDFARVNGIMDLI
ncbi:hypothetical protein TNCV_4847081 [Trichonephila clavipes]|nr:hypothetical protein TNCV_4847081 [Trichonephila clavipes]